VLVLKTFELDIAYIQSIFESKISISRYIMMNYLLKMKKSYFVTLIVLSVLNGFSFVLNAQVGAKSDIYFEKAELLKNTDTDSAIVLYKKSISYNRSAKDTTHLIKSLCELSNLYAHSLDYGNAYDGYWDALLLSEKINDNFARAEIYQALGWLYLFYRRDSEAIKYFNHSIQLKRELIAKDELKEYYLLTDYFSLINLFRTNGNNIMARKYIDSSVIIQKKFQTKSSYLDAEIGYQDAIDMEYDLAINRLNNAKAVFEKENPSYLIIINYLLGEVYYMMGDMTTSRKYFKTSLALTEEHTNHSNYKLMDQEALALISKNAKDYKSAFLHLEAASQLDKSIFGRQSKNNQHLFEINDRYRIQKEKEKELIKEQHIANLENEEKLWTLKSWLLVVVIFSILILSFLLIRNIRRKHSLEKKSLEEKRAVELQKANEILELKNNELTSSALQLIEKEEFIKKMKDTIGKSKENLDVPAINRIISSAQGSPNSNWKEFEARFTAINQSFYKNLKDTYPSLSQTDLKLCALVKLNFSSKEMSSLLGISIESVHTSRYRLRKKLNLERNDNLTEFIASF